MFFSVFMVMKFSEIIQDMKIKYKSINDDIFQLFYWKYGTDIRRFYIIAFFLDIMM